MYCIELYCIVLYCIVLYCIVLYCIVLYCIVLYCIVFHSIPFYSILFYSILFYSILFHSILLYSMMYVLLISSTQRPLFTRRNLIYAKATHTPGTHALNCFGSHVRCCGALRLVGGRHNNVGVSLRERRDTSQVMLGASLRARWGTTLVHMLNIAVRKYRHDTRLD